MGPPDGNPKPPPAPQRHSDRTLTVYLDRVYAPVLKIQEFINVTEVEVSGGMLRIWTRNGEAADIPVHNILHSHSEWMPERE